MGEGRKLGENQPLVLSIGDSKQVSDFCKKKKTGILTEQGRFGTIIAMERFDCTRQDHREPRNACGGPSDESKRKNR